MKGSAIYTRAVPVRLGDDLRVALWEAAVQRGWSSAAVARQSVRVLVSSEERERLSKRGAPRRRIPGLSEPTKDFANLYFSPRLYAELSAEAGRRGVTVSELVRVAIRRFVGEAG